MAPQRDYLLGEKCCGEDQVIRGNRYGNAGSLVVEGGNNNNSSSSSNSDSGSSVDVKLYVALESSATSPSTSHYPGYCRQDGEPGRPRMDCDVIGGRCPHHVKFGDSEWGNADRPTNQIRVPYQVRITWISDQDQNRDNLLQREFLLLTNALLPPLFAGGTDQNIYKAAAK